MIRSLRFLPRADGRAEPVEETRLVREAERFELRDLAAGLVVLATPLPIFAAVEAMPPLLPFVVAGLTWAAAILLVQRQTARLTSQTWELRHGAVLRELSVHATNRTEGARAIAELTQQLNDKTRECADLHATLARLEADAGVDRKRPLAARAKRGSR